MGYQFDIVYKPGLEYKGVDALSRVHGEAELQPMIHYPHWPKGQEVIEEAHRDAELKEIIHAFRNNQPTKTGFSYQRGVLLYKGHLVLARASPWIQQLLQEFHATPLGGHLGFYRTYHHVAANLFWFGMKRVLFRSVTCQHQKYIAAAPGGLLPPLCITELTWEEISMDFIKGLPKSKGFEAILVVVDRLSQYSHFIAFKHPYTAKIVVEVFTK